MQCPHAPLCGHPPKGVYMKRQHKSVITAENAGNRGNVVSLSAHSNKDTLETLEAITEAVKAGHVRGLVFGVLYRSGQQPWDVGATGECEENHISALGLASKLWARINGQSGGASS
jgi:hypothetical protein